LYRNRKTKTLYVTKNKTFIDGDQWCALFGENIQTGLAGFGKSPELAMLDFDVNYYKKLT
jgi:hypothetical protein